MPRPAPLQDHVLRLLQDHDPRPLTGLGLAAMLRAEGHAAPASLVFRAIRRLIDRGLVRKIHVASAYAPVGDSCAIILWCRACGEVTEIESADGFARLRRAAAGLADARYIVELAGRCSRCAAL